MEDWYSQLLKNEQPEHVLAEDYAPHSQFLQSLSGRVLDVGGGAGIAARYLQHDVSYVVVDPSDVWHAPEWKSFSAKFRGSGPEPEFIKGAGETLPFPDEAFDVALAFWSLNHVENAGRCVAEMIRVMRPGGIARIVLEDSEPGWAELLEDSARRIWSRLTGRHHDPKIPLPLASAWAMKLTGNWTVEEDHFPVGEEELLGWIQGTEIKRREWIAGYLTFDFQKPRWKP